VKFEKATPQLEEAGNNEQDAKAVRV